MTDLQQVEFEMLRCFVSVCDRLGLQYYLLGGTLLGAVRHQGFIPWDDDIDVGMRREDYEVFLREGQALLPEGLFLQSFRTEPAYPLAFAKLRDSRTTFIEAGVRKKNINHGVYIDIFPLDYYPTDARQERLLRLKLGALTLRQSLEFELPGRRMTAKERLFTPLSVLLFPSCRRMVRELDKTLRTVPPSPLLANYCGAWGRKEIVPVAWYGEGTELRFEGLAVRAPAKYERWLTQVYGDYMQLPPEEKRITHHYADLIDTTTPYTAFRREKGAAI